MAAAGKVLDKLKAADIFRYITDANKRPFDACTRLFPKHGSPAGIAAFQVIARIVGNIGMRVVFIQHVDPGYRHPTYACPMGDLAGGDRLQKHGEAAVVLWHLRNHPFQGRLVLECLLVFDRQNKRLAESHYVEAITIRPCSITYFDQGA